MSRTDFRHVNCHVITLFEDVYITPIRTQTTQRMSRSAQLHWQSTQANPRTMLGAVTAKYTETQGTTTTAATIDRSRSGRSREVAQRLTKSFAQAGSTMRMLAPAKQSAVCELGAGT